MMNNSIRKILIYISVISICVSVIIAISHTIKTGNISATQLFAEQSHKIKILIVPGHEPNDGGAIYKGVKERDLNVQLARIVNDRLSQDPNLEVIMARDENGWNKDLQTYVESNSIQIINWEKKMKDQMLGKVSTGEIDLIDTDLVHNDASSNAVLYLYGTNKWIDENNIDLVLHIHFNNNPKINGRPNYRGYAMYIPERQYSNSSSSKVFANYLFDEIDKIQWKSNMPQEKDTIIEDQNLIAIGEYNTLKIPSVVVEYAYIYEPVMTKKQEEINS